MYEQVLPEFQKFLLERKLAPGPNVSYCAYWVYKFLDFSNYHESLPLQLRIRQFLNLLENQQKIEKWQINQADYAIKLYLEHFLKKEEPLLLPDALQPAQIMVEVARLLDKARQAIRLKHYSYSTEKTYGEWIKRFYGYLAGTRRLNDAQEVNSEDARNFLTYLAVRRQVSASTQNQAFNALLFLFRCVLGIELKDISSVVRAKRGFKLPVVLSLEEVRKIFETIRGKPLIILQLLYGSGLRLMELARLRVQDVDFANDLLFVRGGKGDKDRVTMLPKAVGKMLHPHLEEVKKMHNKDLESGLGRVYLPEAIERKYPNAAKEWCWQYVFPAANLSVDPRSGCVRRHHISEKSIQLTVVNAAKKARIAKHVTVHILRHCFATHLLMSGTNIREVQELLGHKNVETTMIYTHVMRDMANAPQSPLDTLYTQD